MWRRGAVSAIISRPAPNCKCMQRKLFGSSPIYKSYRLGHQFLGGEKLQEFDISALFTNFQPIFLNHSSAENEKKSGWRTPVVDRREYFELLNPCKIKKKISKFYQLMLISYSDRKVGFFVLQHFFFGKIFFCRSIDFEYAEIN